MPRPTGPTDPNMAALIKQLKKKKEYAQLVRCLSRPRRSRAAVNVGRLAKIAKENEHIAVPGKVLSVGEITKSINVYAWQFSRQARNKITAAGGKCFPLQMIAEDGAKPKVVVK